MNFFCSTCGDEITDNFCGTCGTPKAAETILGEPSQIVEPYREGELFSERVLRQTRERQREEEKLAAERRARQAEELAEVKRRESEARREKIAAAKSSFLKWKALWFPVVGLTALIIGYGITQLSISNVNGPSKKLDAVINAIKSANFEALNDPSLFPGSSEPAPAAVQAAFDWDLAQEMSIISIAHTGNTAIAQIGVPSQGETFEVALESTTRWEGLFQVPHWRITSLGEGGATFATDASLAKAQKITFVNHDGEPDKTYSVKTVSSWGSMSLLPGYYNLRIEQFGLSGGGDLTSGYLPKLSTPSSIPIYSALAVTPALQKRADKMAAILATKCGRYKCGKLTKFGEYDFNLWSRWSYSKYTSSSFSYKWSLDYCSKDSEEALSPTVASFTYSCNMTANAHLYVKWVYYYGYYSDYYYYDNIYDTKSDTVSITFKLKTSKSGK